MSNQTTIKPKCQTCGHITASNLVSRLSSIKFRWYINSITDLDKLIASKDYFIRFIKSYFKIKEYEDKFLEELEMIINNHNPITDINYIKIWIFNYIFTPEGYGLNKEKQLYKYLQSNYSNINETFTTFYENYARDIENPLTKNKVSRALSALGLKTVMKKVICNSKPKCTIMITATKDELSELLYKNGI